MHTGQRSRQRVWKPGQSPHMSLVIHHRVQTAIMVDSVFLLPWTRLCHLTVSIPQGIIQWLCRCFGGKQSINAGPVAKRPFRVGHHTIVALDFLPTPRALAQLRFGGRLVKGWSEGSAGRDGLDERSAIIWGPVEHV